MVVRAKPENFEWPQQDEWAQQVKGGVQNAQAYPAKQANIWIEHVKGVESSTVKPLAKSESVLGKRKQAADDEVATKPNKARRMRLESALYDLGVQLETEMSNQNHHRVTEIAHQILALVKAQEGCDKSLQKRELTDLLKDTNDDNVATYNKKWKLVAGLAAGIIQITAGFSGVGGAIGGAVLGGTAGAASKAVAGAAQTFSYAGSGTDSAANALFAPTEGERAELNTRQDMQRSERDEVKSSEDSAKHAKSQTWEQLRELVRNLMNAINSILRGN